MENSVPPFHYGHVHESGTLGEPMDSAFAETIEPCLEWRPVDLPEALLEARGIEHVVARIGIASTKYLVLTIDERSRYLSEFTDAHRARVGEDVGCTPGGMIQYFTAMMAPHPLASWSSDR